MRKRGFTLLELCVAIALMALVAGSLYGSLYIGSRAHNSATAAVAPIRTAALTLELLQQDFDSAMPPTGVLAGAFTGTDGSGTGDFDSISFFSSAGTAIDGRSGCDIRRVDLSVENIHGENDPVLIRRITSNLLPISDPLLREQVLCRHVKTFSARYYDGTQWMESWDSTAENNVLPMAIEISLEFIINPEETQALPRTYRISRVYRVHCGRAPLDSMEDEI